MMLILSRFENIVNVVNIINIAVNQLNIINDQRPYNFLLFFIQSNELPLSVAMIGGLLSGVYLGGRPVGIVQIKNISFTEIELLSNSLTNELLNY